MTIEQLRAEIPALADVTYLNYGATGPSPRPVVEAVAEFVAWHEHETPAGEGMYPAAFDTYEDVRATVADLLGCAPTEVALTESTSDGINRFVGAFDWNAGDVVVRTDMEHPAGILPLDRLARRRGVELRVLESEAGRIDPGHYAETVQGADLVVLSALTWTYGTHLPVAEFVDIAHEAGARVLVDAVQSVGQCPVDVRAWGADAVAAAGHKWLLGPWGSGFLYVDGELAADLEPGAIGYRSVDDAEGGDYELKPGATRFEVGTTNPGPHVGLQTAIERCQDIGIGTVEDRIERLAGRLVARLPESAVLSPSEPESGLVTIAVDDPEATVETLAEAGFVIRSIPEPDAIRVSVHAVNTEAELDALVETLRDVRG